MKKLPEFFALGNWARFCFYLNNQRSYGQMDGTGGFSALNWSKNNPPYCSDSRLLMLYKVVKIQLNLGTIFVSRDFLFWLVTQQPVVPSTNRGHRRIQRIK